MLDDRSKSTINQFITQGVLPSSLPNALWKAKSQKQIISLLKDEFGINEVTIPRLWNFLVCEWGKKITWG